MTEFDQYFNLLRSFDPRNEVTLDPAHNLFLFGAVVAHKPRNILELGMGSGFVTATLHYAIKYNGVGELTSVDNWLDFGGREPPFADQFRGVGINVVAMVEEQFVRQAGDDAYDCIVSDADHLHSHEWLDQHLRIVRHDGLMFFHDTNQPGMFPGLSQLEWRVARLGLPHYHFRQSSRPDERCHRGWLFVINKKPLSANHPQRD